MQHEIRMDKTTDPIIISYGTTNGPQKVTGLLVYENGKRSIIKYDISL